MKRKIDIQKINKLMENKKQKDLAEALDMPESNLSSGLSGKRTISMGYILALSKFFNVKPNELTVKDLKKNETNI